jgi:hypothetical protein
MGSVHGEKPCADEISSQVDVEVTSEAGHPEAYAGSTLVVFSITPLGMGETEHHRHGSGHLQEVFPS